MALLDTDALESLLSEADRLAVALHGNSDDDSGLLDEIRDCVKCMEDAIRDLGGAYAVEQEAADRLEKARDELRDSMANLSKNLVKEINDAEGGLKDTIRRALQGAIEVESKKITADLAKALKTELLRDVTEDSVYTVLGRNVDDGTKKALANQVLQLEAEIKPYREHYKEAQFWRRMSPIMIGTTTVGAAAIAVVFAAWLARNAGWLTITFN